MKIKLSLSISIILFAFFHLNAQVKNAVVFGDHAQIIATRDYNIYRVFMDMNGDFYPENNISNEEMKVSGESQLAVWSKSFPDKFQNIATSYNLENTDYSELNYHILQDSIRASIIQSVNRFGTKEQTWLMHGFRKQLTDENIDNVTSPSEYAFCRGRINNYISDSSENSYVEVYWDGKYMLKGGAMRMIKVGRLYKKKAIPNAKKCGYALRNIFHQLECQKTNLITHSTGTYIASSLLFNRSKEDTLPTPNQSDIRIALTASASPGKKLFKNYYLRNTAFDFRGHDNYALFNFINEKDEALLKSRVAIKFPKLFGNTTLGCNYHGESEKLNTYFTEHFPNSIYCEGYNVTNQRHWFISYVQSEGFEDVLNFLFK